MSNYPKRWIEAVHRLSNDWSGNCERAKAILDALREVGALKEPPKPREWWIRETTQGPDEALRRRELSNAFDISGMILVREVED